MSCSAALQKAVRFAPRGLFADAASEGPASCELVRSRDVQRQRKAPLLDSLRPKITSQGSMRRGGEVCAPSRPIARRPANPLPSALAVPWQACHDGSSAVGRRPKTDVSPAPIEQDQRALGESVARASAFRASTNPPDPLPQLLLPPGLLTPSFQRATSPHVRHLLL